MQHFIIFIFSIFFVLVLSFFNRKAVVDEAQKTLRVYGYSSFTSKLGPGFDLKKKFELTCNCRVEFVEAADSGVLLQRIKLEGATLGADLVIGLDQYDLQKALSEINWRKLDFSQLDIDEIIRPALSNSYFVPFDWGVIAFVGRKEDPLPAPKSLRDLTKSIYKNKIALMDPRTSSPGMQFLSWVYDSMGKDEGEKYLEQIMNQAHSFSPSWSTAYGFFSKRQVSYVLSYLTSPLYHQLIEHNNSIEAFTFTEKHPIQFEFAGIPLDCKECTLAEEFINLMLSDEGQKIIMNKNFMFPVIKSAQVGTPFEPLSKFNHLAQFKIPSVSDVDFLIKSWTSIRRGEKNAK